MVEFRVECFIKDNDNKIIKLSKLEKKKLNYGNVALRKEL